ncbi:LacI family transcriptional regulator [Clostridiales bacterium COT073_COT-073]|nr:LacI family transcriptional regulator [Clostridiales bacterium COT073_COT-073]
MKTDATIHDVARWADVSIATVSRVINNKSVVKFETKQIVERAMKELKYHPNSMARCFVSQKTSRVALIVDIDNPSAFDNPFFQQVQFGIEKVLAKKGYSLSIYNKSAHDKGLIERLAFEKKADGILLYSLMLDNKFLGSLKKSGLPFVCIGETLEKYKVDWVDVDNYKAGELAVEHLSENKYKKILVTEINSKDVFNIRRIEGIKNVLKNKEIKAKFIDLTHDNFRDAYEKILNALEEDEELDAVLTLSNHHALAAQRVATKTEFLMGREFAIITFDSYPVVELSMPRLTTVDVDVLALGSEVARALLQKMENQEENLLNLKIIPKLCVRESTVKKEEQECLF